MTPVWYNYLTPRTAPYPALPFNNLHMKLSRARAIEFAEIHALPGAQHRPAVLNQHELARSCLDRLHMRGSVSFSVAVLRMLPGVDFVEPAQHISHNVRIGILINRDASSRMRAIDDGIAILHAALPDCFAKLVGHFHHLIPLAGRDLIRLQLHVKASHLAHSSCGFSSYTSLSRYMYWCMMNSRRIVAKSSW